MTGAKASLQGDKEARVAGREGAGGGGGGNVGKHPTRGRDCLFPNL